MKPKETFCLNLLPPNSNEDLFTDTSAPDGRIADNDLSVNR
jgi:hypothetical protein